MSHSRTACLSRWENFKRVQIRKKSVACALCAQAERCLPLWSGQEKAARWWRCGNSRGVIFYVGMKCICTLHSAHTAKHIAIDTGHTTVCTHTRRAQRVVHIHGSHIQSLAAARSPDPAICSAQSFPASSKPEPALNSRG